MAQKSTGGESKQALIIMLVLLVLVVIVVGVIAYYGYADQADLMTKIKELEGKQKVVARERDEKHFGLLIYKHACGANEKDDTKDFQALKPQNAAVFADNSKKLARIAWDAAQDRPAKTYPQTITELEAALKNEKDRATAAEDREKQLKDDHAKVVEGKDKNIKDIQDKLAAAQQMAAGDVGKKSKEFDDAQAIIKARNDEIAQLRQQLETQTQEQAKVVAKLNGEVGQLKLKLKKTEDKLVTVNLIDADQPKGHIVRRELRGPRAYVNIGSAERVKPQLTFSIFAPGKYSRDAERKGTLEVTRVVGDHLAEVRITEERSPTGDPIQDGDLIFNPAWSPNFREHIAIAGVIDLTGEGRDNTPEFIRALEKQNIMVDAYLDMRDLNVKGKMSLQTSYLVIGQSPEFDQAVPLKDGDPRTERQKQILEKMGELQQEAREQGTTIVPLRRFLALIGYRMPRTTVSDFSSYDRRPGTTLVGPDKKEQPPMKEMPAPDKGK